MMPDIPNGTTLPFPPEVFLNRVFADESDRVPHHVLGMHWEDGSPVLVLRRLAEGRYDGEMEGIDLSRVRDIDLRTGRDAYCVGRIEDLHLPCKGEPLSPGFSQCWTCLTRDIPDPRCIFEPHCDGTRCGAFFCQVPHVVYLAMYGTRMKVGMTQEGRVHERGTEQGADLMMVLARTADRYSARALEDWISTRYRIPQALHGRTVLKDMERGIDIGRSMEVARGFMERLRGQQIIFKDALPSKGIRVLTMPRELGDDPVVPGPYPIPERLSSVPRPIPVDIVRGEVVGFKGKWGIIRSNGTLAAFRMVDLVGRIVHIAGNR